MEYLNNLLYKHLKSESPAWWNTIINDPDIHIEIRKEYSARQKAIFEKELEEAKSTGALIQEDRLWGNFL